MHSTLHQRAFLLLLAIVTIAFLWILIPFYGAVFWAVILGIIFRPVQVWLESRLKRRNLAAAISVIFCIVLAIIPMTLVLASLINQGAALVDSIQSGEFTMPSNLSGVYDALPDWAQSGLDSAGIADFDTLRERLASALRQASQFLATQALSVGQNTLRFFASLGIMLYVLFFMFRDGPLIGRAIRDSLPLSRNHSDALLSKFAEVVRATVKGNVIIALIQGSIGGVAFWALGIQGALIWGAAMVLASMIPAVGAALIWAPGAAYLILSGDYLGGFLLIAVGVAIIGLVDNVLRPPLVGAGTRLPDYVILVSTLGGLSIFGINGFVIGPLIAALFFACWTLFRDERAGGG